MSHSRRKPVTADVSPRPRMLLFVLCFLLSASSTGAQTHGHQRANPSELRTVPPVQIRFRGELKPDSAIARGLMEIEITNRTDDTIPAIRMFAGVPIISPMDTLAHEPPYLKLDSMLYRGVPLSPDELTIDSHTLTVNLPQPLPPGERAFFITTFTTRMRNKPGPGGVVYTGWYPNVAACCDTSRLTHPDSVNALPATMLADYTVALTVDSVWHLAHPGELVNDKDHYGLLPPAHNDSIYIDIVHEYQQEFMGRKYRPFFESGRKTYLIRSLSDIDFPIVAWEGLLRDRAFVDSLIIEVCYPPKLADVWAGRIVRAALKFARKMTAQFGPAPITYLRIAPADCLVSDVRSRQIITLPYDVREPDSLTAILEKSFSKGLK